MLQVSRPRPQATVDLQTKLRRGKIRRLDPGSLPRPSRLAVGALASPRRPTTYYYYDYYYYYYVCLIVLSLLLLSLLLLSSLLLSLLLSLLSLLLARRGRGCGGRGPRRLPSPPALPATYIHMCIYIYIYDVCV